ncbi:hypothetical protein H4R24_001490 [Coemansia sp. RSA 988]|nr:hypothetical protein H4R24_001490 [Coemansia sp. RSA 988]
MSGTLTNDNPIVDMALDMVEKNASLESNGNPNEDTRNKIRFPLKINRKLAGSSQMAGKYPIIEAGGRVYSQYRQLVGR